jgi:hypothetical protein
LVAVADPGTPSDPLAELAFEIERFEWTGEDRLEVTGRWFGVRGLRFIRPTLHVRLGERRRRLIALLDDKPWPPDAEGPWVASFTWEGPHDGVTAARLEVAPDVVLDLPMPGGDAAGRTLNPRPRPRPKPRKKPAAPRKPKPAKPAAKPRPFAPTAEAEAAASDAAPPAQPAASVTAPPAVPAASVTAPPAVPAASVTAPPADAAARAPSDAAPPAGELPPLAAGEPPGDDAPRDEPPAVADEPQPSPAAEIKALALERRLVEERAARERVEHELAAAREQLAALAEHQASAVERAQEVVRLEGELAAANRERDEAVARAGREVAAADRERAEAVARAERAATEPRDVSGLEAELAAAKGERDQAVARAEQLAEAREPLELAPLPSRFDARRRRPEWGTRAAAVVLVLILLGAFALILSLL